MGTNSSYQDTYDRSLAQPEQFWLEASSAISWSITPSRALDSSHAPPLYGWFPEGALNTCYNALDRHVLAGRGEQDALVYDSAMLGIQRRYSYAELTDLVSRFAGVLRGGCGVGKGGQGADLYAMIPEAVVAMLATARLGAVHSVVFGGFAPKELAARIKDAAPVAVVTASGGIEPSRRIEYLPAVAEALELAGATDIAVLVKAREGFTSSISEQAGWLDWDTEMTLAVPAAPLSVKATDPPCTSFTLPGQPARPRVLCATTGGPRCGTCLDYGERLRRPPRGGRHVGSVRRRMGGRALVHGVRTPTSRGHFHHLRGKTGRDPPRCRSLLAGCEGSQGQCSLHCAHCASGDTEGRS